MGAHWDSLAVEIGLFPLLHSPTNRELDKEHLRLSTPTHDVKKKIPFDFPSFPGPTYAVITLNTYHVFRDADTPCSVSVLRTSIPDAVSLSV